MFPNLIDMQSEINLAAFIERLQTDQVVFYNPFLELYDWWFTEISGLLKEEITDNLINIQESGRKLYLQKVKSRLVQNFAIDNSTTFLDSLHKKYMLESYNSEQYQLRDLDFPYKEVYEIKMILSTWIKQPDLEYDRRNQIKRVQRDFYRYASLVEASKMVAYINSLITEEGTSKKAELPKFRLTGKQALIESKAGDLHSSLMKTGYLEKDSKLDFTKLFTGKHPQKKILWTGSKGELKCFIDLLFSMKKIEMGKNRKWKITANNFTLPQPYGDFSADNIKDAKKPKDIHLLEQIIGKLE